MIFVKAILQKSPLFQKNHINKKKMIIKKLKKENFLFFSLFSIFDDFCHFLTKYVKL